ncbi:hypothetical protein PIB30_046628 [Stylosanthes scabra]|uniref:PB1-like domain-containing protein n=1 Tax=Stylosanthes scabra TaxID=79078 RepID=A0ABU6VHH2_9FABA|nr:hypothetical protein [Stylosanthes scabra]
MGLFDLKVHHGGMIEYGNEIKYVGGESIIIEGMDSDWWSLFEAYSELRRLGYPRDPILPLNDENLFSFSTDADSEEMYRIAKLRNHVEMHVVHEIEKYEEPFPECGYIDVGGGANKGGNEGANECAKTGDCGGNVDDGAADGEGINAANDEGVEVGLGTMGGGTGLGSDVESDDEEFVPSEGDIDSADDVHFTDSEDDYDDDSCFEEQNGEKDTSRNEKGRGVVNEGFSGEDCCESDELDDVYQTGVGHAEAGEGEEDDFGDEGGVFPVYKPQKDMKDYR